MRRRGRRRRGQEEGVRRRGRSRRGRGEEEGEEEEEGGGVTGFTIQLLKTVSLFIMVFGCSCNKTIEYRNVNLRNCFYDFYSIVLDVSLFTKTDTCRRVSLRQLRAARCEALYSYRVHLIPLISMSATKQQSFAPPPPPLAAQWRRLVAAAGRL